MNWSQKTSVKTSPQEPVQGESYYQPGHLIADKYKVIELLGRGGAGTVYHVEQVFLANQLALKLLDLQLSQSETQLRRFQQEAKATCLLNHVNLVRTYDFGLTDNQQPYLVMELVKGLSLSDYIKANGPLSVEEATEVFSQAASGLKFAHDRGIVHRDIKPGNLMIVSGMDLGAPGFVKVVDFGIAKVSTEGGEIQALTKTGEIFGSPFYMSPEQGNGNKMDLRTDIYSLGCSLYEALTGTPPFVGATYIKTLMLHQNASIPTLKEGALGVDFPKRLEDIVAKMLQKDANARYPDCDQFLTDLQTKSSTVSAPSKIEKTSNSKFYSKLLVTAIGGIALVIVAAMVFTGLRNKPAIVSESEQPQKQTSNSTLGQKKFPLVDEYDRIATDAVEKDAVAELQFKKSPAIVSKLVPENGQTRRTFKFPDAGIGAISGTDTTKSGAKFVVGASGSVYVPPDSELCLRVGGEYDDAFRCPDVYKKIGPNEFVSLEVLPPVTMTAHTKEDDVVQLAEILKAVSHWKKLQNLAITSITLKKEALDAIDNMKALTSISLIRIKHSDSEIAKRKFLQRMVGFYDLDCSANLLLEPLSRAIKLRSLVLQTSAVDEEKFKLLQQFPELVNFHLVSTVITDPMIDVVSKCPKLRTFCVEKSKITLKQMQHLLQSQNLEKIVVKGDCGTEVTPVSLHDPRVRFEPAASEPFIGL